MIVSPDTLTALQEAIRSAPAVTIAGGGTKVPTAPGGAVSIDMSRLRAIAEHSPAECVVTVQAGTPLADIDRVLRAHGQYLPFDPPLAAAGATIGGTVAMGLNGPGRLRYGGVRDFLIGATVVDGEGRAIRSGGKVVKNAAGFLLHHALVGSQGTLGALTELTFKVFPAPEAHTTLRCRHSSFTAALETIERALTSRLDLDALDADGGGTMWLRLAGRRDRLRARLAPMRQRIVGAAGANASIDVEVLDGQADTWVWTAAREFAWCPPGAALIKVPSVRAALPALAALATPAHLRVSCGGAVVWLAWEGPLEPLSRSLARLGRPALVVRGPGAGQRIGRTTENVFETRVRHVLDPAKRFHAASAPAR